MVTRIKLCDGTSSILVSFQESLGYIISYIHTVTVSKVIVRITVQWVRGNWP